MLKCSRSESFWQSISDLMTGLMIIFMFICMGFLYDLEQQKGNYNTIKNQIYRDLHDEFKPEERNNWGTKIDPDTLTVMFVAPRILFGDDERIPNNEFKAVLRDFFPRYIKVIRRYDKDIVEVRIEGNASKKYNGDSKSKEAYFYNMDLSQGRAFNVLKYVYSLDSMKEHREWMKEKLRANGASFSKAGKDDVASRYVEISIQRNAEEALRKLNEK